MALKTFAQVGIGIEPRGAYDLTFGWTRDDNAQQTTTLQQGGGDVLGPADENEFTLGTSALAGSQFVERFQELEEGGEFRSIQYQVTQNGVNEDLELHSLSVTLEPGALSTEN